MNPTLPKNVRVRTSVRAGALTFNHNKPVRVRSSVRAGVLTYNHNKPLRAPA